MLTREDIGDAALLPEGEEGRLQGTLAQRLEQGPLPPAEALARLSEVAGALWTLDAFGEGHAHVVPARILLTRTRPQRALLRADGADPAPGVAAARPDLLEIADYLAPEVAAGGPRTTASDVYALACVLVEALTGAPPFAYDRPALVLAAHREAPPPRMAAATGLPDALDRVLTTALAKDPEQRQRTAPNLLRGAQRALGPQRHPIPTAEPPPRAVAAAPPPAAALPPAERTSGRRRSVPSRRPAPSVPRQRASRRLRARRLSATGVAGAVVLAVSATAGLATGLSRTPDRAGTAAAPVSGAALAVAHPGAAGRGAATAAVARAIAPLDAARTAARQKLRAAEAPPAQASAAHRLAVAYRDARRALPPPAALANAPGGPGLPPALAAVERGYRRLALAAWQGNAHAYTVAAEAIRTREAQLDAALTRLA